MIYRPSARSLQIIYPIGLFGMLLQNRMEAKQAKLIKQAEGLNFIIIFTYRDPTFTLNLGSGSARHIFYRKCFKTSI